MRLFPHMVCKEKWLVFFSISRILTASFEGISLDYIQSVLFLFQIFIHDFLTFFVRTDEIGESNVSFTPSFSDYSRLTTTDTKISGMNIQGLYYTIKEQTIVL